VTGMTGSISRVTPSRVSAFSQGKGYDLQAFSSPQLNYLLEF
jgi:hypothetical protein